MANFDSGEPISGVSGSILSSFFNSSTSVGTGLSANTFAKFEQITVQVETGVAPQTPIYRGLVGSNYVVSVGSPPVGATFVTIIGFQ